MAQITLSIPQIQKLVEFCIQNNQKQYFIAKDQGAYLGASMGGDNNCIFYFRGCDPKKDADWYDNAHSKFGGDDFGEHLEFAGLLSMLGRMHQNEAKAKAENKRFKQYTGIQWNVTTRSISMKAV